jgi:DNA-binding NarL/FixJ family response regulator
MKRIFLIDDHPMLREGLVRLIEQMPDCEVCGESDTSAEGLAAILRLHPDLVILDISLPDKSGLELVKDLKVQCPDVPILIFSMHDEMLYAVRAVRAGAKGYLMKGTSSATLKKAIDSVLAGERYLSARVCEQVLGNLAGKRSPSEIGPRGLTDRELAIFELIGHGNNSAQIGDLLHISTKTVDAHRANIRTKLALPDSNAVARAAVVWVEVGSQI